MQREIHGGNVYGREVRLDFSVNINPLGMPQGVRQAITEYTAWDETYPDIECTDLRRAIAQKEGIAPEQILCGNGASELLMAVVRAAAPEKCAIAAPSFSGYERAVRAAGAEPVFYELSHDTGFGYETVCDRLSKMTVQMLFLCNPNNPTGHTIPPELMERISAKCRETGTFLVVDECFLDFVEGGSERSARQFLSDNSAILKAFTKIYAMPGIRLGYALFGSSEAAEKAASTGQSWSVSTPAQAAGFAALRLDGYVEKTVEVVSTEREFMQNGLRSLGLEYVPSEANFILFRCGLPLDELLSQRGIALRNCENYDGLEPGWFRTAVRLREENALLLDALREVLNG